MLPSTRRRSRRILRRVLGIVSLAAGIAVFASIVALAFLLTHFGDPPPPPTVLRNGGLVVSKIDAGGRHLFLIPDDHVGDREPTDEALVQLTRGRGVRDVDPSFDPSGTWVVFVRRPANGSGSSLWITSQYAQEARQLTDPRLDAADPAWSPEGTPLIAFTAAAGGGRALFVISPDGSGLRALTSGNVGQAAHPSWSADGTQIVFAAAARAQRALGLLSIAIIGGGPHPLDVIDDPAATELSWSPDRRWIAYVDGGIWVAAADGSEARQLTDTRLLPGGAADVAPSWSPDGSMIVFTRRTRSVDGTAWAVRLDGSPPILLADGSDAAWQPMQIREDSLGDRGETIAGVPFPACSERRFSGDLPGQDVVVFTRGDRFGCGDREQRLYIGVEQAGSVTAFGPWDAKPDGMDVAADTPVWLFGTPDIDADGTPEIALGVATDPLGFVSAALFTIAPRPGMPVQAWSVEPIVSGCDIGCRQVVLFIGPTAQGTAGAFCGATPGLAHGRHGLVEWTSFQTGELQMGLWRLERNVLMAVAGKLYLPGEPDAPDTLPPDGSETLCGSSTSLQPGTTG